MTDKLELTTRLDTAPAAWRKYREVTKFRHRHEIEADLKEYNGTFVDDQFDPYIQFNSEGDYAWFMMKWG